MFFSKSFAFLIKTIISLTKTTYVVIIRLITIDVINDKSLVHYAIGGQGYD